MMSGGQMAGATVCKRCLLVGAGTVLLFASVVLVVARGRAHLGKPLPLKSPLSRLNADRLRPYACLDAAEVDPETIPVMTKNRGISECVRWIIEAPGEGERRLELFALYASGPLKHMTMPHYEVPRGLVVVAQGEDSVMVASRGMEVNVPLRVWEVRKATGERFLIARLYRANGMFCGGLEDVARIIASSTDRYAYSSKVEVRVDLPPETTREWGVNCIKRFLRVAVPVLLEDHWPEWSG